MGKMRPTMEGGAGAERIETIHFPTRITQNTCSLLDNIFTNNLDHMFTGVLTADISDHLPIFSLCHKQGGNIVADKNSHRVLKRNLSESNIIKFCQRNRKNIMDYK